MGEGARNVVAERQLTVFLFSAHYPSSSNKDRSRATLTQRAWNRKQFLGNVICTALELFLINITFVTAQWGCEWSYWITGWRQITWPLNVSLSNSLWTQKQNQQKDTNKKNKWTGGAFRFYWLLNFSGKKEISIDELHFPIFNVMLLNSSDGGLVCAVIF